MEEEMERKEDGFEVEIEKKGRWKERWRVRKDRRRNEEEGRKKEKWRGRKKEGEIEGKEDGRRDEEEERWKARKEDGR